jgi:hypothetical protein
LSIDDVWRRERIPNEQFIFESINEVNTGRISIVQSPERAIPKMHVVPIEER